MGIVDKMKQTLGGEETADKAKDKTDQVSGKASEMSDQAKGMVTKVATRSTR